jgi:hypothetical protein
MGGLSISAAWDETRAILASDGQLYAAVVLALLVLPQTVVGLMTPVGTSMTPIGRFVWLAAGLVGLVAQLALARLAIGPSTSVGEAIAHGARRFLPTFGAFLVLGIGFAIIAMPLMIVLLMTGVVTAPVEGRPPPPSFALLALVVALAAVFLSIKFILTVPISTVEQPGPIDILKRSWRITTGHYWRLLAFVVLMLVTSIILLIATRAVAVISLSAFGERIAPFTLGALVLGLLESVASGAISAVLCMMLARIYVQLAGRGEIQAGVPNSGI